MRFLVRLALSALLLWVLIWGGAQALLLMAARGWLAGETPVAVTGLAPLTDPRRVGLRMGGASLPDGLNLGPGAIWAPMTLPPSLEVALPASVAHSASAESGTLMIEAGRARMTLSPLNRMALSQLTLRARGLSDSERHSLSGPVDLRVAMATLGASAPPRARAAYEAHIAVDGLQPGPVARLTVPGLPPALPSQLDRPMGLSGRATVYLDATLAPLSQQPPPRVVGVESDGLTLRLDRPEGPITARAVTRIATDAQGTADGEAYLYTADAGEFLTLAAEVGLIPDSSVKLALAGLNRLSELTADDAKMPEGAAPAPAGAAPEPATPTTTPPGAPASATLVSPPWPPAPEPGEIRLPFRFEGGKAFLGPFPLGAGPGQG